MQYHYTVFFRTIQQTLNWSYPFFLHSLKACGTDPREQLEKALDAYAADKDTDMFEALYGGLDLNIPVLTRGPIKRLPECITGKSPMSPAAINR